MGESQRSVTSLRTGPSGTARACPPALTSTCIAVGRSCLNRVPASPIDGGRSTASVTGAGSVITSLTRKLPSNSGRVVMAMPGAPTVALGRAIGVDDVRGVGRIVRAGDGAGRTSVDWLGARDGTAPAGWRAEGAAEPGHVSPAPTATAAPSRAVTVNAPTERRRASRARAPAMCHLPRDATVENFVRHF